jgi:GntR family transcriptional regulator / MocR family aminotransferase
MFRLIGSLGEPGWVVVVAMGSMLRSTGPLSRSTFRPVDETSQPIDVLVLVTRDGPGTLGSQIEDQLRRAIRDGSLKAGARVPSTRDLARQLGVSRRIVVDAYSQLSAEGYLVLRQGARPRVSGAALPRETSSEEVGLSPPVARFDFRPGAPDVSSFPRAAWQRALRDAVASITDADLLYGNPAGMGELRSALAEYLGRVRGVVADPSHIVVTSGYSQAQGIVCRVLRARGATRIALENPSHPEQRRVTAATGLEIVPVGVDEGGVKLEELERTEADAVVLTPAHQHPTGVVLAGDRRPALLAWLRERNAIAIEDDYDAEYRYDRAAVGALQGLDPDRVVYAGTVSKTLAPGLRLGWLAVPAQLLDSVINGKALSDWGTPRIEQLAFANFLSRGELDRHLRRMRAEYRRRRDLLVEEIEKVLPEARVRGVAAGLHATVELPDEWKEEAILDAARARGIDLVAMGPSWIGSSGGPPTLLVGYGQLPRPAISAAVRELADAVRAAAPANS